MGDDSLDNGSDSHTDNHIDNHIDNHTDNHTDNRSIAHHYWAAHFQRDWEAMATFFTDDVHYDDIGAPGDGCRGPAALVSMLRLGLEPLEAYIHHPQQMLAEGDTVVTEHIEEWRFPTGEVLRHPYVSIFTMAGGKIAKWHDYSNIANITDNVPDWWIEHVSAGWTE